MKTRILFTINNLDTAGMKYVLADIAFGLEKNLFTPVIIVNKRTGSILEKQLETHFEIHEINLRFPGFLNLLISLSAKAAKLKKLGDIAHSFDYSSDWCEGLIMRLVGIPYIVEKTNMSLDSWRWRLKLGIANHIVCLSSAQLKQLKNYSSKITCIPTGINIEKFSSAQPATRSNYGLKDSDIVLISVAHLVEVKGYEELFGALAILKDEFQDIMLLAVGEGDPVYEKKLRQLVTKLNLTMRIVFAGNSGNIEQLLKIADGLVLATQNRGRKEAFGAVLVEAMASGLPVIATRSGGPEDIVMNNETGWLVDADGIDSLVLGIRKFMKNKSSWKTIGQNGRKRAVELYSHTKMINSYSTLYKHIVNDQD